jgi:hypothetical protein
MEGDVEKREVSPGGNGREAESERGIPGRRIIGTAEGYCVDNRWLSTGGRGEKGAS